MSVAKFILKVEQLVISADKKLLIRKLFVAVEIVLEDVECYVPDALRPDMVKTFEKLSR